MRTLKMATSLLLIAAVVAGCGKKLIPHTPNPSVQGDLKAMLYQMLSEQQGVFQQPLETKVADDAFVVTWLIGQGLPRTVTIYYTNVVAADILFRKNYVVQIKYAEGAKYNYKCNNENTARQFVDVLWALKTRAQNPALAAPPAMPAAPPPQASGCNPPCSPGYMCVGNICQPQCNPPCGPGMVCGQDRSCQPAPPPPAPPQ